MMSTEGVKQRRGWKHGLTSTWQHKEWFNDGEELAEELITDAPRTPEIVSTARELGHAILFLRAVQAERRKNLATPMAPRGYKAQLEAGGFDEFRDHVLDTNFCEDPPPEPWAIHIVELVQYPDIVDECLSDRQKAIERLRLSKKEFLRIDSLERRAFSRRNRLAKKLDHLIIEAKRYELAARNLSGNRSGMR